MLRAANFARFWSLLVIALLITNAVGAQDTPVTLTMWHIATEGDPFRPVLQGAIERFNATHADVRIEAEAIEQSAFKRRIENALASGQQPDIFQTWGGGLLHAYVREGSVRPIPELSGDLNRLFVPAALAPSTFDGQHYAVPANMAGVFLWYNRDLFEQHGVELPLTWDQLLAACRAFRAANITPVALGNREGWPGSLWYAYLVMRSGHELPSVDAVDLSSPAFIQAGEYVQEAVQAGCFEENFNTTSFGDAQQRFGTAHAAMQLQGDWNLGGLRQYQPPPLDAHIGVLPFPSVGSTTRDAYLGGTGQAFAIAADAPPQTAAALLELLTHADYGRAVAESGYIPALAGYDSFITDPLVREMAGSLRRAPYLQLYYDQLFSPEMARRHLQATTRLFALLATPEQAVQETVMGVQVAQPLAVDSTSLRQLAAARGLPLGAAVSYWPLQNDVQYAETLRREFNLLTPEVELKWGILRPNADSFDFGQADTIIDFAADHNMQVRGHTLVWHRQLPGWLEYGTFSRDEMLALLQEHITTVVSRYRGRIAAWDVVNEAFNEDGTLRDTIWLRTIGSDYIDYAFRWAHEADPDALLFYNDYNNEGLGAKSDAVYALVAGMIQRGVPIHGVGLQMHVSLGDRPVLENVRQNIERLGSLGLQVHITEMDVAIQDGVGSPEERLAQQAEIYGSTARLCLAVNACTAFVMWGFTDRHTWIPGETGNADAPLIFDTDYRPKPAYAALVDALSG